MSVRQCASAVMSRRDTFKSGNARGWIASCALDSILYALCMRSLEECSPDVVEDVTWTSFSDPYSVRQGYDRE